MSPDFLATALTEWLAAGAQVLALTGDDEDELDAVVTTVAAATGRAPVMFWSSVRGLTTAAGTSPTSALTRDLGAFWRELRHLHDGIVVAHDLVAELERPTDWRMLRELDMADDGPILVITRRPSMPWPAPLDWVPELRLTPPTTTAVPGGGLSARQLERLRRLSPAVRAAYVADRLRRAPGLVPVPAPPTYAVVGGLHGLKRWVDRRALAFRPGSSLPRPRGLLFFGVQGTGKSLAAQALAPAFGLDLWRLEFGALFGRYVGESEARLRTLMDLLERTGPAVIWIDEVDKALAGATGGADSDAGTAARLMGSFLTWLSERPPDQVVVAVANQLDALPSELLRAGRFDEWFFFDLPGVGDRAEILRIYAPPALTDASVARVAAATDGFTGADLAQLVVEARFMAAERGRDPGEDDLAAAAAELVPFARRFPERVAAMRDFAEGRARRA